MKKLAKRFLIFTGFFLVFSILINSVFLGILALTDWDCIKRIESLKFDNPDYELLVLGASLTEYGIDTELLTSKGIKSFNLSLVGSSVKTSYIQLNEYLSKYPKRPRYVMLVVNSQLERFDQDGIQPVVEFTMKNHKYNPKDIPISKFNWEIMELFKKAIKKSYRATYVSFGQKKSIIIIPDKSEYRDHNLDLHKYESAVWIGEIAKLCSENKIEFIVIDIPAEKENQNNSDIGPYTLDFKNGNSAVLYNLNSRDFCSYIDSDKDWSGMSHFNKFGAEKFTEELYKIVFNDRYCGIIH